jgi:hypothetical protein
MLNISYIIPLVCFWQTLTNNLSKHKQEAISNNIISFIHCLLFIVHHHYDYNIDYAVHMSMGYYMYDLMYIFSSIYKLKSIDEIKTRFPFIIHHFIGIYLLNETLKGEHKIHLLSGYNILETSNIMLYVSYHLHKEYPNYFKLHVVSEFFQLLWYFYFRIIHFSLFAYTNKVYFLKFNLTMKLVIGALYCMGIIWSYKLVKKNIKNYSIIKGSYGKLYMNNGCSTLLDSKSNND